jgi:hypothetical protein
MHGMRWVLLLAAFGALCYFGKDLLDFVLGYAS